MALIYERSRLPWKRPEPTFHPFPNLPIELRLAIWYLALPDGQVVEISYSTKAYRWLAHRRSYTVSGHLRANQESRAVYLEQYCPLFPLCKSMNIEPSQVASQPISYFNTEVDTLYIGPRDDRNHIAEHIQLPMLRTLAFNVPMLKYLAWEKIYFGEDSPFSDDNHAKLKSYVDGYLRDLRRVEPWNPWDGLKLFPYLDEFAVVDDDYKDCDIRSMRLVTIVHDVVVGAIKWREPREESRSDRNHLMDCRRYGPNLTDSYRAPTWNWRFFGLTLTPRFIERGLFRSHRMHLLPENEEQYVEFGFSG